MFCASSLLFWNTFGIKTILRTPSPFPAHYRQPAVSGVILSGLPEGFGSNLERGSLIYSLYIRNHVSTTYSVDVGHEGEYPTVRSNSPRNYGGPATSTWLWVTEGISRTGPAVRLLPARCRKYNAHAAWKGMRDQLRFQ